MNTNLPITHLFNSAEKEAFELHKKQLRISHIILWVALLLLSVGGLLFYTMENSAPFSVGKFAQAFGLILLLAGAVLCLGGVLRKQKTNDSIRDLFSKKRKKLATKVLRPIEFSEKSRTDIGKHFATGYAGIYLHQNPYDDSTAWMTFFGKENDIITEIVITHRMIHFWDQRGEHLFSHPVEKEEYECYAAMKHQRTGTRF